MKATVAALLGLFLLAGCAPFGWENVHRDTRAAVGVDELLFFSDRLAIATETELATMPARRPAGMDEPRRALRHALWLATPGHDSTDTAAARALLERLATRADGLDAGARALVRLHLRHLRRRIELASANERLRRETERLRRETERLREQIRALTALEREMGDDEAQGDNGDLDGGPKE